jgi:hypothetical protein
MEAAHWRLRPVTFRSRGQAVPILGVMLQQHAGAWSVCAFEVCTGRVAAPQYKPPLLQEAGALKQQDTLGRPQQPDACCFPLAFASDEIWALGRAALSPPKGPLANFAPAAGNAVEATAQERRPEALAETSWAEAGANAPCVGCVTAEGAAVPTAASETAAAEVPPWANATAPPIATSEVAIARTSPNSLRFMVCSNLKPAGIIEVSVATARTAIRRSWRIVVGAKQNPSI